MTTIKFNVGGTRCQTLKSTLDNIPYFKALFDNCQKNNKSFEEEIFLDLDYDIFKHVLNKYRDAQYEFPDNEIVLKNIDIMMKDYFGVEVKENKQDIEVKLTALERIHVIEGQTSLTVDTDSYDIMEIVIIYRDNFRQISIKNGSAVVNIGTNYIAFFEESGEKDSCQTLRLKKSLLKLLKHIGPITITAFSVKNIFCVTQKIV